MSFQQLFYTSCEQGLSDYAGYQFNAVTDGTSGETMRTVETLTAYEPPHSCAYADTAEELDRCPVNLCFAPGKIAIVANVRYVGRDSSQRFGNYFAHALATGDLDLDDASLLPIELWRADWWNCRPAAATSLPTLDGPLGTGPLSRDRAAEFLGSHPHRGRLPALLSAAGLARSRADRSVLVVAESADDVANWFAAVSYLLPPRWVRGLSFSTYLNRPSRSRLHLLGTLPETDLDLGPDADEKFYLFDFQAGRFADVDEHPLTSLCAGIGVTELPALWAWADRLASGSESTLDDWYPVVAAAAALGRVLLTETDLGSVIGWLKAAGALPDETQTAVARAVHSHPAITREHRQVLLAVGERTGDAGLWEQVQYGLLEPLLLARTDGQAAADALAPSTVTAVPRQSPARVREQLTAKAEEQLRLAEDPRDTLALLDWAGLAGLPAAPDVLAECGRRMVAPLLATDWAGPLPSQQRDQAGRVTKRWPAVREGIVRYLTALASSRPADVAAVMAGITGELLTWQDIPDDSPIRVPYLVHQRLRQREAPAVILGRLAELGLIMDVDDLLLSMLWPKGIWTLAEAAQVLAKVDPRVLTGVLGWFDATLATTPPQPGRDDYGTLCTALMTSPLAAAPAIAKMPVLHEVAYLYRVWSAAQRLRDLLPAIEAARDRESAPALVLSRQWLAPRVAVLPADTPGDIISALRQLHPAAIRRYLVVARDRFRAPIANTPMHAAALWYLGGTEWVSQYDERIEELFNYVARGWPQEYLVQTARQLTALDPAACDDFSDWIGVKRSGRFAKIPRALRATGRRLGRIMSGGPPPASPAAPPDHRAERPAMEAFFEVAVIVLAVAGYVGLVIGYFVFVAPVIAAGAALYVAGDLVAGYFHRMHAVLVRRAPEFELIPPYRPGTTENGPEPAYRQYFFGPAMRDLRQIIMLGWQRGRARAVTLWDRFITWTITAPSLPVLVTWPVGVTLLAGLIVGALLGALLGGTLAALHALAAVSVQLGARACIGVLRAADTVVLYARGVRGMRCPWCYERNTYPAYHCICNRLHRDIRPGRYGVFRRRCACDRHRLPTLILLGSYRMNAFCVYCNRQMSDETGRFREVVLPLLGGRAAGKTRLMAAMLLALDELARTPELTGGNGTGVRLANAETQAAFSLFREVLDARENTLATPPGLLPHAHSVQLRTGRHTRLVHIFDPSGERLVDREGTDQLRYLEAADTFLFVLDPMSAPGFWDSLAETDRSTLDRTIASRVHPQEVFDQALQQTIAMGARVRRSRLTVAISKTDLIEHTTPLGGRRNDDQWARSWLTETLGLGNLVRSMDKEFRNVHFFFTAAVTVPSQGIHESIMPLVVRSLSLPGARH